MRYYKYLFFSIIFLNSVLSFAQQHLEKYKRYPIKNVPSTQIEIDGPIDSVLTYFMELEKGNVDSLERYHFRLFNDYQAFITEESAKKAKKGNPPHRWLYSHEGSLSSIWDVHFEPLGAEKTVIKFKLQEVLTDSLQRDYFNNRFYTQDEIWKTNYENKKLVSRGIIENLLESNIRKRLLPDLLAVDFSENKGFDNKSYQYENLVPHNNVDAEIQFYKEVPSIGQKPDGKSLLVFDRNSSTLSLIEVASGKVRWKKPLENIADQNLNKVNVYQNTVYVPTSSGYIYAMSLLTGEIYWRCLLDKKAVNTNGIASFFGQSLPISDDYLYANYDGIVYKINRFNGKVAWSQTIGGYGHYNYSFDKDRVYKTGILECFVIDKKTGKVIKIINNTQENTFYSPNVLDENEEVIYLSAGKLYAFDLKNDKILWNYKEAANKILKENNVLYVNSEACNLLAIDRNSGNVLWENTEINPDKGESDYINDIYLLPNEILLDIKTENYTQKTQGKKLVFINKKDGSLNLINHLPEEVVSNPILSGNKMILLTPDATLTMDIETKELTEKKVDLSFLNREKSKGPTYEHQVLMIE